MVCLDTGILVALLKCDPDSVDFVGKLENKGERIKASAIFAYELIKGSLISSKPEENLKLVGNMLSGVTVLTLNRSSSEFAARIHGTLRKMGKIVGELDILIAGICAYNDELLVSRDSHFREVGKALNLVSW